MKKVLVSSLITVSLVALSSVLTGCSTLTAGGTHQPVTVLTYDKNDKDLNDVKCELVNDEGTWSVTTPNTLTVKRSNKDLFVTCKKDSFEKGTASVVSKTKGNMFGNIIFGGGIGAIIDHNNGSAYEYPATVKVTMGKDQRIDEAVKPASTDETQDKPM